MDLLSNRYLLMFVVVCCLTAPTHLAAEERESATQTVNSQEQQATKNQQQASLTKDTERQTQAAKLEPLEIKKQIRIDANIALPQDI